MQANLMMMGESEADATPAVWGMSQGKLLYVLRLDAEAFAQVLALAEEPGAPDWLKLEEGAEEARILGGRPRYYVVIATPNPQWFSDLVEAARR